MISYLSVLRSYAVFHGRARRLELWMFLLVSALVSFVLQLVVKSQVPNFVYSLAVTVPTLAVLVRRLHDVSRSGWWLLLGVVPIIGQIVLFVFLVTRGDRGANRFGSDPMAMA